MMNWKWTVEDCLTGSDRKVLGNEPDFLKDSHGPMRKFGSMESCVVDVVVYR